jgi:Cupin-like domain
MSTLTPFRRLSTSHIAGRRRRRLQTILGTSRSTCHLGGRCHRHHHYRRFSSRTVSVDEHHTTASNSNNDANLHKELASILQPYYRDQRPVVVRGAVRNAHATRLWTTWEYWQQVCRCADDDNTDIMVAVEMGGSYGAEQSERAEIPFAAYLQYLEMFEERHGKTGNDASAISSPSDRLSSWSIPSSELVYMAQNDLPQPLYKDIFIPDFCQNNNVEDAKDKDDHPASNSATTSSLSTTSLGLGRLYSVMLWLGPRGSVSPLHFDPLDNCLMQHVGRKRVLLYEPKPSSSLGWHYAGHDGQQNNTSPVNPEVLDDDSHQDFQRIKAKYPLFLEGAPPRMECWLDPGDLLYIPAKWWHHVRSIDTSASVNVWWR